MKKLHGSIPAQVFLLILTFFLFSSNARIYDVTGRLVTEHRNPIANHQIILCDDNDIQIATDHTDSQGNFHFSYQGQPTSAEPARRLDGPSEFALGSSYLNPFNPRTVIPLEGPERTNTAIAVYNIPGQEVMRTRADLPQGSHEIVVNLGSGDGLDLDHAGIFGNWWSSSEYNIKPAWVRSLFSFRGTAGRRDTGRQHGFSVRYLRD